MNHKRSLSDSFFSTYALWQIIGLLGYFYSFFLVLYMVGLLLLVYLTFTDRKSLLGPKEIKIILGGKKAFELHQKISLQATFLFTQSKKTQPSSFLVKVPSSEILLVNSFSSEELKTDQNSSTELVHELHGKAHRLGHEVIDQLQISSVSRLSLWKNQFDLAVPPIEYRVFPAEKTLNDSRIEDLLQRQPIFRSGSRRRNKSSSPDQFHSLRKYVPGDPKKLIDSKKSAKYGELMTRTFEEQRAHHLILCLDLSRTTLGTVQGSPKSDFYLSAALKLAEMALQMGDQVSLIAFSNEVHQLLKSIKRASLLTALYRGQGPFRVRKVEPEFQLLPKLLAQISSQRAMVFILTDPTMPGAQKDLLQFLLPVCRKHLTLILGVQDERPSVSDYAQQLKGIPVGEKEMSQMLLGLRREQRLKQFTRQLNRWGGGVVYAPPQDWMATARKAFIGLRNSLSS